MTVAAIDTLPVLSQVPSAQLLQVVAAQSARRSLSEFLRQWWAWKYPGRPLQWGWHIDAICEHLEAVSRGEITRLVINVPPRTLKSTIVSVAWPAWEWIENPWLQYIAVSAINSVVLRDAKSMKDLCRSEWYTESFQPEWRWERDQDAKGYFTNSAGGHRISRTTGQRITGSGADRIIVDDPIDAKDAFSDKKILASHVLYFDQSLTTRLNDEEQSAIVVIMQRLHERDLSGHLRELGGYEHLVLPAEYDGAVHRTSIGWTDPRKQPGELLFPRRLTAKVLEDRRRALGSRGYAGQYLQQPAPEGGTIFREEWIQYWIPGTLPEFDFLISSWDCTFRKSDDSDFVAGQVWGVIGEQRYLLDQIREKMNLTDTLAAAREILRRHRPAATVVELKANGKKVIATLHSEVPGLQGFDPQNSSKEERANAVLPIFEAGQVFIPHPDHKPWIREAYLPELLAFPQARRDDQVDATTQALLWIREHGPVKPYVAVL